MTVGKWTIRRPKPSEVREEQLSLDPLKRGLVIEWDDGGGTKVCSFPVPYRGWAWAWPWILYNSIKMVRLTREAYRA